METTTHTTTTLLKLIDSVSDLARDDRETVRIVGDLLNRRGFMLAGNIQRQERFLDRLTSLPATG